MSPLAGGRCPADVIRRSPADIVPARRTPAYQLASADSGVARGGARWTPTDAVYPPKLSAADECPAASAVVRRGVRRNMPESGGRCGGHSSAVVNALINTKLNTIYNIYL